MLPTRRRERRPRKYTHAQVANKKVSISENTIKKSIEQCHDFLSNKLTKTKTHNQDVAPVIACIMTDINERTTSHSASFIQQYMVQKGIKKFGVAGSQVAIKELSQLHKRNRFTPVNVSTMTTAKKSKAVNSLLFLTKKRTGEVKGRMLYNSKPTREWLSKEGSASPTTSLESIYLTAVINAKENHDVMTADIPNVFILHYAKSRAKIDIEQKIICTKVVRLEVRG